MEETPCYCKVRKVETAPCEPNDVLKAVAAMLTEYIDEGINLRMEYVDKNMNGQRLTVVFDWEDTGC